MTTLGRIVSQMLLLVFGLLVTNVVPSSASNGTERHSVSVAKRERESNITLSWLNPRTMQIIWPDKVTDFIHLQSSKNLDGKNVYVSLDPTKHAYIHMDILVVKLSYSLTLYFDVLLSLIFLYAYITLTFSKS